LVNVLSKLAITLFGNEDADGTMKLINCFDLICGTSTGGILSVALVSGFSIKQARGLYLKMGSDIFAFGYSYIPARWARYYTYGDYYSSKLLRDMFSKNFGEEMMSNIKRKVLF